jgi:D-alanyl-D-alanine-carboxypeptidase/D-alanyl-D-alanine-endopeptidase
VKRTFLISSFLFAAICCLSQNIDSLVQKRIELGETPGMVVGVFSKNKIAYYAHGVANNETGEPVTSATLFEIGSITKTFTATMLALMVERGNVALEDPVQKFLPSGSLVPERDGKRITLENLATARSGLPRMPDNFKPKDPQNPYIDYTFEQLSEFLQDYQLPREIGSAYEYSNLGMGLLGYALSQQSHRTWSQLLKEMITQPLQMNQTFLNTDDQPWQHVAKGYTEKIVMHPWTWNNQSVLQGAGGIISNAEDMLRYLVANLDVPSTPLGKAMVLTHEPRHDAGAESMQIGLGWHILNSTIIWHGGGTGGFRSFSGFNQRTRTAVIILTNSTTGADDLGFYLLDQTMPLKKINQPVSVDPKILTSYVGEYELNPQFKIIISLKNGSLYCQATGQNEFELFPKSPVRFFLKSPPAEFEFVKNSSGQIEKLVLFQGGNEYPGRKVK